MNRWIMGFYVSDGPIPGSGRNSPYWFGIHDSLNKIRFFNKIFHCNSPGNKTGMLFGGCGGPGGIGFRPGVAVIGDQAALGFVVCFAELV